MVERLSDRLREFLKECEAGKEVSLKYLRSELKIDPDSPAWSGIRQQMRNLVLEKIVKPSGRGDGIFKVLKPVNPIKIFSVQRERRPPFDLKFPRDFDTGMTIEFADKVVVRGGDCILIAGQSNFGKTALAMNFLGENIGHNPVLLGNEFSKDNEPDPRFLKRLDSMDWIEWVNDGEDKFELLPVYSDYEDWIKKDRINIADWINLPGEYYLISPIMEKIKQSVGINGIAILVIQKNEGADSGRGGSMTKDFADLELLIDRHTDFESRLTIGKVKEYTGRIIGRSWAYEINDGVKLRNIREVVICPQCHGKKWVKWGNSTKPCEGCNKIGWIDK